MNFRVTIVAIDVPEGVVLDRFAKRAAPGALHSEETLEENGSEAWTMKSPTKDRGIPGSGQKFADGDGMPAAQHGNVTRRVFRGA
ncbi:MAG TPA: hypothetical protein VG675_00565 [Bryobacteraceae bacterium]|nr:hypothetical protein [Bryobacteraceae bacterium]